MFLKDSEKHVTAFKLKDKSLTYEQTCPSPKKEVVSREVMWNGKKPKNWFWEDVKLVTITNKPP